MSVSLSVKDDNTNTLGLRVIGLAILIMTIIVSILHFGQNRESFLFCLWMGGVFVPLSGFGLICIKLWEESNNAYHDVTHFCPSPRCQKQLAGIRSWSWYTSPNFWRYLNQIVSNKLFRVDCHVFVFCDLKVICFDECLQSDDIIFLFKRILWGVVVCNYK